MQKQNLVLEEQGFSEIINQIQVLKNVKPKESWVISCRAKLALKLEMEHKREMLTKDASELRELFTFWQAWQPKWAFRPAYAVAVALAVVMGGGALTSLAALQSVPGAPLYPVKIALERTGLKVAPTDSLKMKMQKDIVGSRLSELRVLVKNHDSAEVKNEKVAQVVESIHQQLITDKEQLPQANKPNGSEKSLAAAKIVSARADQVKKAITQAKEKLPSEVNSNLSEKLAEVTDMAEKTSMQALEMMIAKKEQTEADKKDILAKFDEIIKEKELAIKTLAAVGQQASKVKSSADKLPINAVLINQADEADDLLGKVETSVKKEAFGAALETLKTLNEIVKGAEKIAETVKQQDKGVIELNSAKNATSSALIDSSK